MDSNPVWWNHQSAQLHGALGGSNLHVAVLTDFGAGDKKKVRELRESNLLRAGHVFSAEMFAAGTPAEADVEDILGRMFYTSLVAATYGLKPSEKLAAKTPDGAPVRVVQEVEEHFKTLPNTVEEYDHYAPSVYLVEHSTEFSDQIEGATLDGFENLFKELNVLLP